MAEKEGEQVAVRGWRRFLRKSRATQESMHSPVSTDGAGEHKMRPRKWIMGILNDKETDEVPGRSGFGLELERALLT